MLVAVATGLSTPFAPSRRRPGAELSAFWSCFARLPAHRCRRLLRRAPFVQPVSAWCWATCTLVFLTRLPAHRRCRWPRLGVCVQPASASFCVTSTPFELRSLACSPPPLLASARLPRPAGVGPVLSRLHAGPTSLACLLTAVAVCFGAAFACIQHRLGAGPHAHWSSPTRTLVEPARLRAHRRRR